MIPLIEGEFKEFGRHIKADFYRQVNPFPQIAERLRRDGDVALDTLSVFLALARACKASVKNSVLSDLASASFHKIKGIADLETAALRTVDEKALAKVIRRIRELARAAGPKILDVIGRELAFRFTLSPFLGKQFDGLARLERESFSQALVGEIRKRGVVEHVLGNLHQDLAPSLATVLARLWGRTRPRPCPGSGV